MGADGAGFEFGVELAGDEEGVVGDFDHFDQALIGAHAAEAQAGF